LTAGRKAGGGGASDQSKLFPSPLPYLLQRPAYSNSQALKSDASYCLSLAYKKIKKYSYILPDLSLFLPIYQYTTRREET